MGNTKSVNHELFSHTDKVVEMLFFNLDDTKSRNYDKHRLQ